MPTSCRDRTAARRHRRQITLRSRAHNRAPREFARARMRGMSLHNHRIARRQRRRRISSRNRERERKVARTKHNHRPQRPQHRADVRPRHRLALWQRLIDARVHPRAILGHLRKQTQLSRRARKLTFQTRPSAILSQAAHVQRLPRRLLSAHPRWHAKSSRVHEDRSQRCEARPPQQAPPRARRPASMQR